MSHQCTICYNDFSWDPSAKNKSHLPVQSRVCSHVLCYSCMISIYQAQADQGDVIQLACPECRLKGAHDPFVPIISLPICELLAERNQMVKHDPNLKEVNDAIRRQSIERRLVVQQQQQEQQSAGSLLAQVMQEQVDNLRRGMRENLYVERPLLRFTMEASRAFYWGSILMFGTLDRNQTATVNPQRAEKALEHVAEKLEEPFDINLEDALNFSV